MINKHDFNNSVYENIEMVQGDTLSFNFMITGLRLGTPVALNATYTFSCADEKDILFTATSAHGEEEADGITLVEYNEQKDVATYAVYISPAKTKDLELARYYYDLQMEIDDNRYTLLRGRLELLMQVSRG